MPANAAPQPIGSNLPLSSSLPKVSFRRIPEEEAQVLSLPAGVDHQIDINFGYNDGSIFEKPEHYLRYVEPIEADLKRQVEYDMDEQDKEWLDVLNAERKKDQLDALSYETFEIIVDRLEKEWFDLMKRVPPKPQPAAIGEDGEPITGNEDTECAICDDGECENSNAIVFCDGCNLAVHQDCYGIPYIPEGQWLCRKCTVSPDRAVSCLLCPHEGGAFKQTTHGKWAHLLCAMWIPETGVSNPVYMEPIDSVERIPKARWKLQCYLCRQRHGACIQCDNKTCVTAFHVTCARKAGLLIKAERQRDLHHHHGDSEDEDEGGEALKAMCHKHLPKHLRQQQSGLPYLNGQFSKGQIDDDDSTRASTPIIPISKPVSRKIVIRRGANGTISAVPSTGPATTKSARAYKKSYKAGPPLVPAFIIERVSDYISKIRVAKKATLLQQIAKFWSLKREARRGAPLLKRLHLEPWTATAVGKERTEEDRLKKLQFMLLLREDLERLRMLAELVRKREREKLRQVDLIRTSLVEGVFFPFQADLRQALQTIVALDRSGIFTNPVSRSEVPDYYEVVKRPMDWATITARVEARHYDSVDDFAGDIDLVCDNAMLYNKVDTAYHRNALKIKKAAEPILDELKRLKQRHHAEAGDQTAGAEANADQLELEPPYRLLESLDTYDEDKKTRSVRVGDDVALAPSNAVEDFMRLYHTAERPVPKPPAPPRADRSPLKRGNANGSSTKVGSDGDELPPRRRRRASFDVTGEAGTSTPQRLTRLRGDAPATDPGKQRSKRSDAVTSSSRSRSGAADTSTPSKPSPRKNAQELSDWDTFKRFETGWVLPEGSKRNRSAAAPVEAKTEPSSSAPGPSRSTAKSSKTKLVETLAATASRKKQRARIEDQAGEGPSSPLSEPAEEDVTMADRSSRRSRRSLHASTSDETEAGPSSSAPKGKEVASSSTEDTPSRPSRKRGRVTDVTEADSSKPAVADTPTRPVKKPRRSSHRKGSTIAGHLEPGTLCWAKLRGFPFFPAEIISQDEEGEEVQNLVPEAVWTSKPPPGSVDQILYLVRFFDSARSFGWISSLPSPPSQTGDVLPGSGVNIAMLLEDEGFDEKMIKIGGKNSHSSHRKGLRDAYQKAKDARDGILEEDE